jgi:hypothetical protein
MNSEALVVGISSFLGVAIYLYIALRLSRRLVSPEARMPATQFLLFWVGLAASTALSGILSFIAVFQAPPFALTVAFEYYDIVIVAAALWGLISYLFFLYTGRSGIVSVTALYIIEFGLLVYYVSASVPSGVSVTYGEVVLTYSSPLFGPIVDAAVLILVIPEFVAGFAYLRLFFRAKERTVRYRIALVSGGILGWFFLDFVDFGSLSGGSLLWLFLGRVLLIIASLIVLMAYYPPRYIREHFGIAAISEAPAPAAA